jgi:cytochrome c biogenesis protein CcmG/thiol:disulfide interchange protein DsbE
MNRKVLLVGFALAAALVIILFAGLGKDPQAIDSPLVGRNAPPFTLREVGSGQPVSLESLRGKPVVLNFWATWCGPCYEEHPTLVAVARANPNVRFLGVVFQDSEAKIQQFLNERGRAYPTVVDDGGKTAIAYGIGGVPETFFLDATGKIVAKYSGPLDAETLAGYVAKAVQQ